MSFLQKWKRLLLKDWVVALLLLALFFATHGYRFAWDDQHLEIPLLKSYIDTDLFTQDYYVQSLRQNFKSYLYVLLSKLIRTDQVPAAYFCLFLFSRYFLFFWMYKFWRQLAGEKFIAFLAVLSVVVVARIQPFLYLTFSHTEFTLPFLFAGLTYFFRDRFLIASCILGLSANFHAMYSFFPFVIMMVYLLLNIRKHGLKTFVFCGMIFTVLASPFIFWFVQKFFVHVPTAARPDAHHWLQLFRENGGELFFMGPYTLQELFASRGSTLTAISPLSYLVMIYIFSVIHNRKVRIHAKIHVYVLTGFALLILNFIASYVYPNKLIMVLSFYRAQEFLLFILVGAITWTFVLLMEQKRAWIAALVPMVYIMLVDKNFVSALGLWILMWLLFVKPEMAKPTWGKRIPVALFSVLCLALGIGVFVYIAKIVDILVLANPLLHYCGLFSLLFIGAMCWPRCRMYKHYAVRLLILVPFILCINGYVTRRIEKAKAEKSTMDLLQEAWIDMQLYVKTHTPKEATILAPYDMRMGGFRIYSERNLVVCERDLGVFLLDMDAYQQYKQRMKDMQAFKLRQKDLPTQTIKTAINKYGADYIVVPSGISVPINHLMYQNSGFTLLRAHIDPMTK